MNRYTLLFAILVASTFAVQAPQVGEVGTAASGTHVAPAAKRQAEAKGTANAQISPTLADAPAKFIERFIEKSDARPTQPMGLRILFFTAPHPLETHLASSFDQNVDALKDGLQDVGYEFDSAWMPWREHPLRDAFDDDVKEQAKKSDEDQQPGVLLFRKSVPTGNAYRRGLLVFLISEKPTEGISLGQVKTALQVLHTKGFELQKKILVLGPTFSGSLASLGPVLETLHAEAPKADFVLRSGGLTGGHSASVKVPLIAAGLGGVHVDFGSAQYDYAEWNRIAEGQLDRMGIDTSHVALLSEDESSFGSVTADSLKSDVTSIKAVTTKGVTTFESIGARHSEWSLRFPRDISSLRAGYEDQGIFDSTIKSQPWNRSLTLKSGEQRDGDTIRSFGSATTIASQEAILFGISEFLKFHGVRAVIVSATNVEDLVFLTQFLHAHNAGVRIVLIGGTRLMMRGAMSQFRGDLFVDNYPMLPKLHDWTSLGPNRAAEVFADDVAEGTYFAAIDLLGDPSECKSDKISQTVSNEAVPNYSLPRFCDMLERPQEYSEPTWDAGKTLLRMPPIYVAAMGSQATWPIAENPRQQKFDTGESNWRVTMPFELFPQLPHPAGDSVLSENIEVALSWKIFFLIVATGVILYCSAFWLANPVQRSSFASMMPTKLGSFWLFKVILPASSAALAFRVLGWAVEMPYLASPSGFGCWWLSGIATVLAPLSIALSALLCAQYRRAGTTGWTRVAFLPSAIAAISVSIVWWHGNSLLTTWNTGSILNAYREMHWESGLSLVPTGMLFLLALFIWSSEAGNGAALLTARMPLPALEKNNVQDGVIDQNGKVASPCAENPSGCTENRKPGNERISEARAQRIASAGMPLGFCGQTKILWAVWSIAGVVIEVTNVAYPPLRHVTSLQSAGTTEIVLAFAAGLVFLALVDTTQFVYLWSELRALLRALDRQSFKRSFVPIDNFKWKYLWSFTGISLEDRRSINASIGQCIEELYKTHGLEEFRCGTCLYSKLMKRYSTLDPPSLSPEDMAKDRMAFHLMVSKAGNTAASLIEREDDASAPLKENAGQLRDRGNADEKADGANSRYAKDRDEVETLEPKRQSLERLLCLIYIGFIQTIIARLHNLFLSIAMVLSLIVLGFAIYPFVPFTPLLLCGITLLIIVGWAFFKVFSEMDTDPILSRIVDGDERKLQGNFYMKFAEALALPTLALCSSLLPGGAGRILELAQTMLSHTQ